MKTKSKTKPSTRKLFLKTRGHDLVGTNFWSCSNRERFALAFREGCLFLLLDSSMSYHANEITGVRGVEVARPRGSRCPKSGNVAVLLFDDAKGNDRPFTLVIRREHIPFGLRLPSVKKKWERLQLRVYTESSQLKEVWEDLPAALYVEDDLSWDVRPMRVKIVGDQPR